MNRQIRRLGVVLLLLFSALFVQLNYLQVVSAKRLNEHPTNTRTVVRDFAQPRGVIQTSDGVVVAMSEETGGQFERRRVYPEGPLFAHITGHFSFTFGASGVERTYNNALTGRDNEVRLDRLGDLLLDRERTANVTLTMSKSLQEIATNELGARRGAVVALNPQDGAILAMASFPSYDPNPLADHDQEVVRQEWEELTADDDRPLRSRAFQERYFPGSSFKVVTAAVALATGTATTEEPVYPVLTEIPLPNSDQTLANFDRGRCGGALPAALRVSCNTVFAQLGLDIGAQKLSAGVDAFGFNDVPPLDLPFGVASSFPDASAFERDLPGLAKSAIGQQDVQATPLQMALVAGALGNEGIAMEPHVMAEVRDDEAELVKQFEPKQWKRVTSATVANTVRDMMVDVVQSGTGANARIAGVQVAGKTGTAQTGLDTSHVWFVSFAPAENPTVAVAVVLENLPTASEATGGQLAAPIARTIMEAALGQG